jgi:hypothetical protein
MAQTAVEWLFHQLNTRQKPLDNMQINELFEQAKAKEKEQIIDAFDSSLAYDYDDSETYYNKTYNKIKWHRQQ